MSFKDIKSEGFAITVLKNALLKEKIAHAYLFLNIGPASEPSKSVARSFAKALNCLNKTDDSCKVCSSCLKIDKEIHPDVNWLRPAGKSYQIQIEDIRQLQNQIYLTPYEAKRKVYIIEQADCMNAQAANALLKTLEEPPPSSVLILITNNKERLFSTIVSRCQVLRFPDASYKLEADKNIPEEEAHIIKTFLNGEEANFFDRPRKDIKEILLVLLLWFRKGLILKLDAEDTSPEEVDDLINIISFIERARFLIDRNINTKLVLGWISMRLAGGRYASSSAD